jgi:hypothetical protein
MARLASRRPPICFRLRHVELALLPQKVYIVGKNDIRFCVSCGCRIDRVEVVVKCEEVMEAAH